MLLSRKNSRKNKQIKNYKLGSDFGSQFYLHTLMLPGTIAIILFSIIPLFGLILAFKNYKVTEGIMGVFTSKWYGFQNFKIIFKNYDFTRMLINTLGINLIGNVVSIFSALTFALFINEIVNKKFQSLVKTVTYMPHFISWVVYGGLVVTILSADGGLANRLLLGLGLIDRPITFMANPDYFWFIAIFSSLLKNLGWSTILYTAAISGIDQELYEAADLDGANLIQKMLRITIPSIKGTIVIMIIFAVAGIMNNNFDQLFVLQNSFNLSRSEVIDTYIYKSGLGQLQFGMAAAINIFKSALALVLLFTANRISKKITDSGLF